MKFELKDYHQNITDEELLADLKQVAKQLDQNFVTAIQQNRFGKYNSSTIQRRFGTWLKAIAKAGLQKTQQQTNNKIPEEYLFGNLEEVWGKLGRQPRFSEMTVPVSKYSGYAYKRRFGTWFKALEIFVALINKEKDISSVIDGGETSEKKSDAQEIERSVQIPTRRTNRDVNWRLRFLVMKRDNFKCKNCGRSPAADPTIILHVDHIKAWANGGETVLINLQTLCSKCNIGKSNLE
jgi:hypothetical protein